MSHIVSINCVIQDLGALKAACKELGLTFAENQRTNTYYGGQNACLHAIKVPGATYEIGVVANPNGKGYTLAYDGYGAGKGKPIVDLLGTGLEKLKQTYAVQKACLEAKAKGWMVARQTMPNGSVKLTMSGM